jgi:cephalosporin-C deacetylase-like acetyl esterase
LGELRETEDGVELIPAAFRSAVAECFDLFFTGVGGARIHAKYPRPRTAPTPHPAVLLFHGYTGNSGNWQDKLSIKACSAAFPFLCDYRRVWEMDLAEGAYEELKSYFRLFDPTHAREQEVFRTLGYIDVQNLVPRIRAEVLMGTALMDQICPPSTQFAAYNKISANMKLILYPDFGHKELPGHMDRVFAFFPVCRSRLGGFERYSVPPLVL